MYVAQLFAVLALVAQAVALPFDQPTTNLPALAEPVTILITRKVNLSPDMRAMPTGPVGTQGVLNKGNVMYTVNVNIGTPPQTFEVQLDTGSRALWVHSNPCQAECPRKPGFNRGASSTYNTTGETYRIDYPVTHVTGEVGTDTVSLGGYAAPKQEFGVALNVSGTGYKNTGITGPLGMGWLASPTNKFPNTAPWWKNALQGKGGVKGPKPMFGIALRAVRPKNTATVPSGELTLGGVDAASIQGGEAGLKWLPLTSSSYWEVYMDDLIVSGTSVLKQDPQGRPIASKAMLDTGTAGLMGPLADIKALYGRIPGSFLDPRWSKLGTLEYYRYPCNATLQVDLTFSGVPYRIAAEDMYQYRGKANASSTEETCFGNIFGWNYDSWVIGDSFFHSAYVGFRYDPPGVGIGKLV